MGNTLCFFVGGGVRKDGAGSRAGNGLRTNYQTASFVVGLRY